MDFKQLQNFVTVADCRSFTKAAAVLNISQPAISVSIKNLESELRADLLIRTRKEVELTELGAQFIVYARSALREMQKARDLTGGSNNSRTRTIKFGINSILVHAVNNNVIAQFISENPSVKLEIDVATVPKSTAVERVSSGEWDFGVLLGSMKGESQKGIAVHRCKNLTSFPHARKSHPLVGKRMVSLADVSKYDWIRSTTLKESNFPALFNRSGLKPPHVIAQINSFDAIISLLELRNLLTILPMEIVKIYYPNRLAGITTKELLFRTEVNLVRSKDKEISTEALHLFDRIGIFLEDIH